MKKVRLFLTIAILAFSLPAVIFFSCTKDKCSGVNCLNGGACSNGNCSCPTGYYGSNCQNLEVTTIQFTNDAFTPITITVNSVNSTIPVGGSVSYTGEYGSTLSYTAYTYGKTSSGTQVGQQVSWNYSHTFPASGTDVVPLDVSSSMVFLKILNTSGFTAQGLYVNYLTTAQSFDNIQIPNDGLTYSIGYYEAYTNTELYLDAYASSVYWYYFPAFTFVTNQSYTWLIN